MIKTVGQLLEELGAFDRDLPVRVEGYRAGGAACSEEDNREYAVTAVEGLQDGDGNREVVIWGALKAPQQTESI